MAGARGEPRHHTAGAVAAGRAGLAGLRVPRGHGGDGLGGDLMIARHHVALVGAAATLLAASSMLSIFETWTWLFYAALAVGAVVGSAMVARALRAPVWAQAIAMLAALTVCLTVLFPSGTAFAGLIPTPSTFTYFGQLLSQAGTQMRGESIPVPDLDGLLMLTTLGIGGVAFFVDLCAVGLRRPAL